jgi:hypothetical protein
MTRTLVAARLAAAATVLAGLAAVIGLFVPGFYRDPPVWAAQALGADLATLGLAVPLAGLAWLLARRRSVLGPPLAGGVLLYLLYTYLLYAFSVAYNPLTVGYIAIVGGVVWALLLGTSRVLSGADEVPVLRRLTGAFLVAVAGLFSLLWLGQIAASAAAGMTPAEITDAGLLTNPVYALDLAFFLPLAALAGVALLRRQLLGVQLAVPVLTWTALMSAQIVGGFLFVAASGAEVPVPVAVVVSMIGLVAATLVGVPVIGAQAPVVSAPGTKRVEVV